MKFMPYVRLVRPEQWIKNTILFAPLVFSQRVFVLVDILTTFAAFLLFCLASSAVYVINDILDRELDRNHPTKRNRPLASGILSLNKALLIGISFMFLSLLGSYLLDHIFTLIVSAYLFINLMYSLYFKKIVLLDVMAVAAGFVLRAVGGAEAINVPISPWLIVCTSLLALLISFGKRRHEVVTLGGESVRHRPILSEYKPYFLDQMMSVVTASTVITYCLYTISPEVQEKLHTPYLPFTIPFVLYGIFRYLYLIHQKESGGNPTKDILTDKALLINIGFWTLTVMVILYLDLLK